MFKKFVSAQYRIYLIQNSLEKELRTYTVEKITKYRNVLTGNISLKYKTFQNKSGEIKFYYLLDIAESAIDEDKAKYTETIKKLVKVL